MHARTASLLTLHGAYDIRRGILHHTCAMRLVRWPLSHLVAGAQRALVCTNAVRGTGDATGFAPLVSPMWTLYDARRFRGSLQSARVALRKRFGQHLLKSPDTVQQIVDCAGVTDEDHVMEIGPGTGNLTIPLLRVAKHVTAYELDVNLFDEVSRRVEELGLTDKFTIHKGDFMRQTLPPFDLCVANIPFQISSPVVRTLVTHRPLIKRGVIMFQAEFADRLTAKPGTKDYSRLSVNTQLVADVRHLLFIHRDQFRPPPKVDCIVAEIVPREPPSDINMAGWEAMTRLCFLAKNKTLRSVFGLKHVAKLLAYGWSGEGEANEKDVRATARSVLSQLGYDAVRANSMSVEDFKRLYHGLTQAGFDLVRINEAQTTQSLRRDHSRRRQRSGKTAKGSELLALLGEQ